MFDWMVKWLHIAIIGGQFLFSVIAIMLLLHCIPRRSFRWKRLVFLQWKSTSVPDIWLRILRIERGEDYFRERAILLAGCGITQDAAWYIVARKCINVVLTILTAMTMLLFWHALSSISIQLLVAVLIVSLIGVQVDMIWLRMLYKLRNLQMTKEIYIISNQLLYLSQSNLHIHAKLMRCVPFTKVMRSDLERLLADWYHDPGMALKQFKMRLGTDDGMSFVETIDALRQHESMQYYELLRVRISDYKDKLELARVSRKESSSYVLFILAGVPILYTFQVFIYPWVMEGQKLFQALG